VEFLGRRDDQVKINGVRIELGEIDAALASVPGVVAAAAKMSGDARRVVAGYVVAGPAGVDPDEVRRVAGASLPSPARPTTVTVVPALPLSPNGKLDRRRLPDPLVGAAFAARPSGPVEEAVAAVFHEVLGIGAVGRDDEFAALGGDSILAMQAAGRLRRAGLTIGAADVIRAQTCRAIASLATDATAPAPIQTALAQTASIQTARVTAGALTPIQRWFFELDHPRPERIDQYFLAELPGPASGPQLDRAVAALVDLHPMLCARFLRDGTGRYGGFETVPAPDGHLVTEVDLAGLSEDTAHARARDVAWAWEDEWRLDSAPQLRVALLHRGAEPAWLLMAATHLVMDGMSWQVLLEDLAELAQDRRPILSPQATYAELSSALIRYAESHAAGAQLPYWQEVCAAPAARMRLDSSTGPDDEASCATVSLELGVDATRTVVRAGALKAILGALGGALDGLVSGRETTVDLLSHGRELPFAPDLDLSRTVGWCSALFPLRLPIGDGPDVKRGLAAHLSAIPDAGLGYGALRHLAGRDGLHSPAEIAVNYVGRVEPGKRGSGSPTALTPIPVRPTPSAPNAYGMWIQAGVVGDQLRIAVRHSLNRHRPATVRMLLERLRCRLEQISVDNSEVKGDRTDV
jgi:non-ribosomal peptide synthase protein (TIGR01720 family)